MIDIICTKLCPYFWTWTWIWLPVSRAWCGYFESWWRVAIFLCFRRGWANWRPLRLAFPWFFKIAMTGHWHDFWRFYCSKSANNREAGLSRRFASRLTSRMSIPTAEGFRIGDLVIICIFWWGRRDMVRSSMTGSRKGRKVKRIRNVWRCVFISFSAFGLEGMGILVWWGFWFKYYNKCFWSAFLEFGLSLVKKCKWDHVNFILGRSRIFLSLLLARYLSLFSSLRYSFKNSSFPERSSMVFSLYCYSPTLTSLRHLYTL